MTLPNLTLTMDKRTNSQQTLHLRQSERGLSLTAQLSDYNGAPYDLTGMMVRFKDAKAGGKSVSDDNVTIATDPKTGVVTYPVHSQVFAAKGIGWFEIYKTDGTLVDSTQNIPIVVDQDISGTIDNSDYISGLDGIKAQLQGIVNSAQQTIDNAASGANSAATNANTAAQAAQALVNDIPTDPKYKGPKGDTGDGIQLKGTVASVDKLPTVSNVPGDTYLVGGHLYIWQNNAWNDGGELQGPKGDDGRSAYQVWLDAGHTGTESDYLASLIGATGAPGTKGDTGNTGATGPAGPAGESAYQVWLDAGNTGTEADYLASLKGATGPAGKDGADGKDGTTPDLTPYLKSTDAAATYQTQTQVKAALDAKIVPVADEKTASSDSATSTTVLYLVPEAS